MLNPSSNGSTQQLGVQIFQELIRSRPLAFWGGMWASLVVIAYVAALGLLSPGSIEQEKPPEATPASKMVEGSPTDLPESTAFEESQTSQSTSTTVQDSQTFQDDFTKAHASSPAGGMPMWLFGVLALTCATSTLLIYSSLRKSKQQRKLIRRGEISLKTSPTTAVRKKRQPLSPKRPLKKPTPTLQRPTSVAGSPLVTVLPPEESHPLDWGEDSLADVMDIRKRQSLASLLRTRP